MPRSFLIKPRRHKPKEDRVQDITDISVPALCHYSPGRISEDSGIEDCQDPLMSPRSTYSSDGGLINSPGTPEGSLASLEAAGCHGYRQMPQLPEPDARTAAEAGKTLPGPGHAASQGPHNTSPPPAPTPRDQTTSLRHRPIKDLPLIKRPIDYQELMLQEQPHHVTAGVTQTPVSLCKSPSSPQKPIVISPHREYAEPKPNDIECYQEKPSVFSSISARGPQMPFALNLTCNSNNLESTVPMVNDDTHPSSPPHIVCPNRNYAKPSQTPSYNHDYYNTVRGQTSPVYQRQSVITRDTNSSNVTRSWVGEKEYTEVTKMRPMTSSTPRQRLYDDQTENRRPHSPRVAPYHIPSKHYFTDITRITSERSHDYITIAKGQREVITSSKVSPGTLGGPRVYDIKRSTALKPRDIMSNLQVDPASENVAKLPDIFVTSSHYTVLTPTRPSLHHLQALQENKKVNTKTSLPVRRPLQLSSPHWDAENLPQAAMGQDGCQDGFQDGHQDSLRRDISRFKCEECGKSYATFSGLTKHKQFHCSALFKKEFSCKYCSKTYVSLGALKMHIRTHTLPCKCSICGKAFSRPWLLQGHVRTHTGEKPFSCEHCHRSFADRSNLRAHLQTHTDIKKYNCKTCPKTFSRMSLLLKHEDGGCINAS